MENPVVGESIKHVLTSSQVSGLSVARAFIILARITSKAQLEARKKREKERLRKEIEQLSAIGQQNIYDFWK